MQSNYYYQKYYVQKIAKKNEDVTFQFISDKSQPDQFYLEIKDKQGNKKRIAVVDIIEIETIKGIDFNLHYNIEVVTSELFGAFTKKTTEERCESYRSKHLAEIISVYDNLLQIIDDEEEKLDKLVSTWASS